MSLNSSNLQQPIPPGRREEWATLFAAKLHDEKVGITRRLFLFRLQNEWFGIDPAALAMTIPHVKARQLPHQRGKIVEGVINADGRVILCLSLERFAGVQGSSTAGAGRRMLIFSWHKWLFAAAVSEILGVEDVAVEEGGALPESANEALRKCSKGIVLHQGRAVVVLDAGAFVKQLEGSLR